MRPATFIQGATDAVGRLLKTREVCAIFGCCPRTVRRKIQRGELPKPIRKSAEATRDCGFSSQKFKRCFERAKQNDKWSITMICNVFKHKRIVNGKRKTSRVWSGRYRRPEERKITVVALGVTDKQVAQEKLNQLVREGEREAVGLIAPKKLRECAQKPLKAHVVDFIENLRAIGRDEKYVREFDKRLALLMRECDWKSVKDVTPDSFQSWRSRQEKRGKTLNEYLNCASGLMNWMERNERILRNPLKHVGRVESSADPSFKRRSLDLEQLRKLMAVAGPRKAGYLTAVFTGMRRAELEKLQWRDVHLEAVGTIR